MRDSTKCEAEMSPRNIREFSESTKCEAKLIQHNGRELSDCTKFEATMIPHHSRELRAPPNEKREDYSLTNITYSSLSLQYVHIRKSYLAALLQQWEDEIKEKNMGHMEDACRLIPTWA